MLILYSNDCPRCKMLKKKLESRDLDYMLETDLSGLITIGIKTVPVLAVDENFFTFEQAWKWLNTIPPVTTN